MAHQLADVLFLPTQCAVRFDLPGLHDCFMKIVIERQTLQIGLFERDKFLAEFLQRDILAF